MPNTTPHARRCMIINYCQFWHKQFGEVANGAQRLLEAGRLHTPLRRQSVRQTGPDRCTYYKALPIL